MSKPTSTPRHPIILLIDELIRLKSRLQSIFANTSQAVGLSHMELMVLTAVVESPTPPTVPQIGRSLSHPRQVVQRATNSLIAAKLLESASNPVHKRAQLLYATAAGKKFYAEAAALAKHAANSLGRNLDLVQCARLARELHELRGKIEVHLRAQHGPGQPSEGKSKGTRRRKAAASTRRQTDRSRK